jgi:hypothetical protein
VAKKLKKTGPKLTSIPVTALAGAVAAAPTIKVVTVPAGQTAVVIVDVEQMTVPYTVSYAGMVVIKSLVDRAQPLNLLPGDQVLAWAFAHMSKGWKHTIGVSVNGGVPTVLEDMSEAAKDPDHSVNIAIIRSL